MKRVALTVAVLIAMSGSALAAGYKECEELKAEIDAKIRANGAVNYTLEIIQAKQVKDQVIVGSCEGGTKRIAYIRMQQALLTTGTNYELVSRACVEAVADVQFKLSNTDLSKGLIVARPVLEGDESYSKMSILLTKSDSGVSVAVRYDPGSGTMNRVGIVDAYLKALQKRLPDIVGSTTK